MAIDKKPTTYTEDLRFKKFLIEEIMPNLEYYDDALEKVIDYISKTLDVTAVYSTGEIVEAVTGLTEARYRRALKG